MVATPLKITDVDLWLCALEWLILNTSFRQCMSGLAHKTAVRSTTEKKQEEDRRSCKTSEDRRSCKLVRIRDFF